MTATALAPTDRSDDSPGRPSGASVELRAVVKQYAGHTALNGVDLTLRPGELVAVLGPSGCGKTTALRCLAGLEKVTSGSILVDGTDIVDVPTHRRDVGMVFQSYSLFPHLTVRQNVEFGLRMRSVDKRERASRAKEALELVSLSALGERYAHQLSGGQQQRVALARALVTRPRVLLLDEPLSALDAKVRVQLRDEIRRIQRELSITTMFVTHDQEEALAVADRVAVMRDGRIEQVGTPEELYSEPQTEFVAQFVGVSNRIPGVAAGGSVHVPGVELPIVGRPADGPVWALVRPENILIGDTGEAGTVESVMFLGPVCRSAIRLGDGTLVQVQHRIEERRPVGDAVHLRFDAGAVAVLPRE